MEMKLLRRWLSPITTIGELLIDGVFECFILEDVYRGPDQPKVPGKTAIPCGLYRVERTFSKRFDVMLPLLWNVLMPDGRKLVQNEGKTFEGIRIHPGNKSEDTDGCLLPGRHRGVDVVHESRAAFEVLDHLLWKAERVVNEPTHITILLSDDLVRTS